MMKIMKKSKACFIRSSELQQLSMRVILMKYFNQFIVQLYQAYKNLFLKAPLY